MTHKEAAQILEQEKNKIQEDDVNRNTIISAYIVAINLLNRQKKPQKVINILSGSVNWIYAKCPNCERIVQFAERYCHNCTQPLEWPTQDIIDSL